MRVVGIDGKYHEWHFEKYNKIKKKNSKLHVRARLLLRYLFPFDMIYEEVPLIGSRLNSKLNLLRADFYIHTERLLIEVHGLQHYKQIKRFHKTKVAYIRSQFYDQDKLAWCRLNNISLIIFPYNENNTEWENRIRNK